MYVNVVTLTRTIQQGGLVYPQLAVPVLNFVFSTLTVINNLTSPSRFDSHIASEFRWLLGTISMNKRLKHFENVYVLGLKKALLRCWCTSSWGCRIMDGMVVTQETLQEYLSQARRRYGVEVVEKTTSKFMRVLATLMFFNKTFLEGYITTIGATIYWPNIEQMYMHPDQAFGGLFHEIQHAADFRRAPGFFVSTYLGPQILVFAAIVSLLSLLLGNFWLFWLLAILFLAPIPSIGRTIWEMRGTSCGIALRIWNGIEISDAYKEAVVDRFTGPDYYYMMPFDKIVLWLFERYKKRISAGQFTDAQKFTHTFMQQHGIVVNHGDR